MSLPSLGLELDRKARKTMITITYTNCNYKYEDFEKNRGRGDKTL